MATKSLMKPSLATVTTFAEGGNVRAIRGGHAPAGDVRLTINIKQELHRKLKIKAIEENTTVGRMVEAWIQSWK
jgi:nanoRNase/pAp phosphatase (c-di-AMP/oligoRNAs hydrolase)